MYNRKMGILMLLCSVVSFSLMNVFTRYADTVPVMQKAFCRNAVAVVVVGGILLVKKKKIHISKDCVPFYVMRSLFGMLNVIGNFYAASHMILPDASLLQNLTPFFAIIASYIILHERVTLKKWILIAVAIIGAIFVIKPSPAILQEPSVLWAVGGTVSAGIAYTMVRLLGLRGEDTISIVMFFSLFSCCCSLPAIILNEISLTLEEAAALLGVGICGCCGQFAVTAAYQYAPASEISIFNYTSIVFGATFGWLFFRQIPDLWSCIGYVVIIGVALGMFFEKPVPISTTSYQEVAKGSKDTNRKC